MTVVRPEKPPAGTVEAHENHSSNPPHRPADISAPADHPPTKRAFSVFVAGSNTGFCQILAQHLAQKFGVECSHGPLEQKELFSAVSDIKPDILIFDPCEMQLDQKFDLQDTTNTIGILSPRTKMLAYVERMDEIVLRGVLEARITGCVSKMSDLSQLETALMALRCGGTFYDENCTHILQEILRNQSSDRSFLSKRERDVIIRSARGQPSKQIAHQLRISAKTVDTYRARALQKLGLSNREQLINHAIEKGWLS